MDTNRRRLAFTSGMALSLVLAGAGVTTAQTATDPSATSPDSSVTAWGGPDQGGFGRRGPGGGGMGGGFGGGFGDAGFGDRGQGIVGSARQLIRMETVLDLGEAGGIVTRRVEHGTVTAMADGSLTFSLATGESVTVTTDADTEVIAWDLSQRPVRTDASLADVALDADILVWSESQADGSFLASRVTIVPAADTTPTTPEASPEASPAAVG